MPGFFLRLLITALGLWLADALLDGVSVTGTFTLLLAALLLGFVNAVVRPLLLVLTLPITLLTLGLFLLVINAAMLGIVASVLPGFQIASIWSAIGAWSSAVTCLGSSLALSSLSTLSASELGSPLR